MVIPKLDNITRNQIMQQLLAAINKKGKPIHGKINQLASEYHVTRRTISRLWAEVKKQQANGSVISINNKKKGLPSKTIIAFDGEKFKSLEKTLKTTQASVAKAMSVSQSTVWRWKKRNLIRKHTNAIKPALNDNNKLTRLSFCLSSTSFNVESATIKFKDMSNIVHIDEKLFYLTKTTQTYYLAPGEIEPNREIQSKRYIPKIMFMCAVANPIYANNGDVVFDGKIGIFPFTHQVPAQRNSKNRRRGELEIKPIQSITKDQTRTMLIDQVLPAIREKWPVGASKTIYIQQDNAKPHILDNDRLFREAATIDGFDFHLVQQPPNSPDMNVLDLGFFRAIQALQHKKAAYNLTRLVFAVKCAFQILDPKSLMYNFITLQACKIQVLKRMGGIDYPIPHMNKSKLAREGRLPQYLTVDKQLVISCFEYMQSKVDNTTLQLIIGNMGLEEHDVLPARLGEATEQPT